MAKKVVKKSAKKSVKNAAKKVVKKSVKKVSKKKAATKRPAAQAEKRTTTLNPYLTFNGNCEEVFNFYKSVFGGKFAVFSRFKDMPPMDGHEMPEHIKERIMHVALPISKETILMGSDSNPMMGEATIGQHMSLSVSTESNAKAAKIFHALAQGGKITMPIENTFWGSYFGMLEDKFGIIWMISCEPDRK